MQITSAEDSIVLRTQQETVVFTQGVNITEVCLARMKCLQLHTVTSICAWIT